MPKNQINVVTVDDDVVNLEILVKNLNDAGFSSVAFEDGDVALDYLQKNPFNISVVLLDKMMPRMNGMDVLKCMKKHQKLHEIPVIIQTGDVGPQVAAEGINAGAYYYLEKPFDPKVMTSIVAAAAKDYSNRLELLEKLKQDKSTIFMLQEGTFHVQNINQAKDIGAALASQSKAPEESCIAISELIINGIEHGNLGINYEEKHQLLNNLQWENEIEKRLNLKENQHKYVEVKYKRDGNEIFLTITDQGNGFKWKDYLTFDPLRLTDPNGRGIAVASLMGINIRYHGKGNVVTCNYEYYRP